MMSKWMPNGGLNVSVGSSGETCETFVLAVVAAMPMMPMFLTVSSVSMMAFGEEEVQIRSMQCADESQLMCWEWKSLGSSGKKASFYTFAARYVK